MAHDQTQFIPMVADQPTPLGGNVVLYAKIDKQLYYKDDTGTESLLGSDANQVTINTAQTITGAKTMTGANAFNGTLGATTPAAASVTTLGASGVISSTVATGTAPLSVLSTTQVANLNVSALGGATFASPGAIGGTTPGAITGTTITANTQLIGKGTATNDSAATGDIGEVVTAQVLIASPVALTTATPANVTSISLTAGDWKITGVVDFVLAGATTTDWALGISSTSATLGAQDTYSKWPIVLTIHTDNYASTTPTVRVSLAATTTIYLIASATFSAGTVGAAGQITARRMR